MSEKRYEIGVIGCGNIWKGGHWPALKDMPDEAHVRYVYDIDEAAAAEAGRETDTAPLPSADAIFDDEAVDIVVILTPPYARLEYVRRACAAGKHLMLEKPMARTLDEALEIRRLIRQAGVKCLVPFMRAGGAAHRELAEQVRSGAFGEPLAFAHTFLGVPYPWIPLDHWMHDEALSGGGIFDYAIHFLELARACMGEAASVFYAGAKLTGRVRSHDHASLLVDYADGGFGEFTKSWDFPPGCDYGHHATHVICRDAVIVLGEPIVAHTPDGKRALALGKGAPPRRVGTYRSLIAAIEAGAPRCATELDGLRMNEVLDAMERSRATGRREAVTLHEVAPDAS